MAIAISLCCLCIAARGATVELLNNPGFELPYSTISLVSTSGVINGSLPAGWTDASRGGTTHTDVTYTRETNNTVSGSALRVDVTLDGTNTTGANFALLQNFSMTVGRLISPSVWLRAGSNFNVSFSLRLATNSGIVLTNRSVAVTTNWQQFAMVYSPTATVGARFQLNFGSREATLWIDSASVALTNLSRSYFVATNGSDANAGTNLAAPLLTLAAAVTNLAPGDSLFIRSGTYRETLQPVSSGRSNAPISIAAYSNETVTVSGADLVTGWTLWQSNIYMADVGWDLGDATNQVFANSEMMHQARHPNFGTNDLLHPATTSVTVTNESSATNPNTITSATFGGKPANFFVGARFVGGIGSSWAWQNAIVTNSSGNTLTVDPATKSTWWWPDQDGTSNTSDTGVGFVFGLLSLLDADKEWHLQTNAVPPHTLYLRIAGGANPTTAVVEMKRRPWCIDMNGQNYIIVRGLNLRAGAVQLNGTGDTLENCNARFLSHYMKFTQGSTRNGGAAQGGGVVISGTNNVVRGCTIFDTAGSGVNASGTGHLITRNLIYNTDYTGTYACSINMAGSGHTVVFNTAHHSGRDIIVPSGNGHDIRFNEFYEPGQMCKDLGVLYTFAQNAQGTNGLATRIAYNWVHDNNLGGASPLIYLDNFCRNFLVDHNVCWNGAGDSGIRLNGPNDGHRIYNNTLFNCNDANTSTFTLPYSDASNPDTNFFSATNTFRRYLTNNLFLTNSPETQLANWTNRDFRLLTNAPAVNAGSLIPGITDGYTGTAPDLGAYELTAFKWTAGVNGVADFSDDNNDGLPDSWQSSWFGSANSPTAAPSADADGDGFTNLEEYFAGTNPTAPNSSPGLTISRVSGKTLVSFNAVRASGIGFSETVRVFDLIGCTNLLTGEWPGVVGYTNIIGNNQSVTFTNATGSNTFYKLQIRVQ